MADLATAYLLLVPSLKGAKGTIEKELAGVSGDAGSKAGEALGEDMGGGLLGKLGAMGGKLKGVMAGIAKTAAVGAAAAGAASVAIGKQAFDAYASYEQLEGGVAKLYGNAGKSIEQYAASVGKSVDEVSGDYERNAKAQELLMQNAQQAWRTAGMDANEYMENATSFSASLISSLGGDTEKAAQQTDVAMRAISDNVNTFGSNMGDVTHAFQGFAKQNYTMLDNLNNMGALAA